LIEFDEKYFQGETRDGFYIEPMMKRAWAAQMELLKVVDEICKEHGLMYFANWGTLLGAVRHQGFVPWDDDMDISMKREDYLQFVQVVNTEERYKEYKLVSDESVATYTNLVSRFTNGLEISLNQEKIKKYHGCPYYVGIDIDVYDHKALNEDEDQLQLQLIKVVLQAVGGYDEYKRGEKTFEELRAFFNQIEELCGVTFNYAKSLTYQLHQLANRLCMIYNQDPCTELHVPFRRIVNRPYFHFPKEWFDSQVWVPFETIEIPLPCGYKEFIKMEYGENYMTPKRGVMAHEYPFYKEQRQKIEAYLEKQGVTAEQIGLKLE